MVRPLTFKGDKPKKSSKKRKLEDSDAPATSQSRPSNSLTAVTSSEDDSWITAQRPSDLAGPILVVLPTMPPSALATDANGVVFNAELENMIEKDPQTAEPHDVRTVWVVGKVPGGKSANKKPRTDAGTEKKDARSGTGGEEEEDAVGISLKSCYGNYLSIDSKGNLTAQTIAVGPNETFKIAKACHPTAMDATRISSPYLSLQPSSASSTPTYLTISDSRSSTTITTTTNPTSESSRLILRLQARHHPATLARATQQATDRQKISRSELEKRVGRRLEEDEVRRLKRAYKDGVLGEEMLDMRVKGGRDKFA